MMWILLRKELLSHLLTLRLGAALLFTVLLAATTTFIGSLDYSRSKAAYERDRQQAAQALDRATVYSQVRPSVVAPPFPLAIFSRGVGGTASQSVAIAVDDIALSPAAASEDADSHYMKTLAQIDFAGVVAVLLSFLAVVLGFDGICGERQSGTLEQVLANPVPRAHVILAKLVGGFLSLWVPLAVAFLICLLVVLANPDVALGADDWVRLCLFFLLSCLFLAHVYSLSLLVSACTRDAATSLIICLFAWLVGTLGYSSVLPSLARYGVDEPPFQEFIDQDGRLQQAYAQQLQEWESAHPGPGLIYLQGLEQGSRLRYAHPRGYAWLEQRHAIAVDKQLELAERRAHFLWANWEPLAREARLVDEWSILSPFANYQVLACRLAHTTQEDRFFLADAARRYRRTFIAYLRGKGAFTSRRWFTDDAPGREPLIPNPEELTAEQMAPDSEYMKARLSWARAQENAAAGDAGRRLDLTDLPKFGEAWQRPLSAPLGAMLPGLLVLCLGLAAGVLLTVARFLRYHPR
jgi:ABC-type transport system involved in multi-copper enzyme maturation permease subunit